TIVGIKAEPSIEMIAGLIAILKAGAAYLPIDPAFPAERINYILWDSNVKVLMGQPGESTTLGGDIEVIDLTKMNPAAPKNFPHHPGLSTQPCYVLYTSGSTGKPKGVIVEHRNVTAYLFAFCRVADICSTDTVIQLTAYTFDTFVEEVYGLLFKGGRIVIPGTDEITDTITLSRLILNQGVTIVDCTPLLLNEFNKLAPADPEDNPMRNVRYFISGGDVLKEEYVDKLPDTAALYNGYGPTETTVCTTFYSHPPGADRSGISPTAPIGKPITNYRVYILDEYFNLVPIGIAGEICVTGKGVTRGYLNNPELTSERFARTATGFRSFVTGCSLKADDRLYRTGDLGRWRPDGNIEFGGRKDHQVKIRGIRIETGEIETRLLKKTGIKDAVVSTREGNDGEKYLCAYYVPDDAGGTADGEEIGGLELREYLQAELPDFMIPAFFVKLQMLPGTSTGKVDRKNLPAPNIKVGED
ncbi:MAG: amino acid adenylation domain-containing protein, partial [bacterium]|nr:amino acid adenylation domain-containing protein [bacterium]